MKMNNEIHCDLLVVGAGLAGMTAGARAASHGLDTVVAGNPSSLAFSSGVMDYLGVYPAGTKAFFTSPDQGLERLKTDFPCHAYSLTGPEKILKSFDFTQNILGRVGLPYTRASEENRVKNMEVLTAMGTLKPGFMVPKTMAAGARAFENGTREMVLLVVGIKGLTGFSAAQVAQGMKSRFLRTIPIDVELSGIRTSVPPQILARQMENPDVQDALMRQILPHARKAHICGMAAICGIDNSQEILARMEEQMSIPVFEIPGSPPSVPGLRLKNAFERVLDESGARLLSNVRIKDPVFDGRLFTLTAEMDPGDVRVRTRGVILATGRFFGNGLRARRERIVETLFHLDVAQPTGRHLWHDNRFLTPQGHKINQAGVETDDLFRPLDERGRPVYSHLYAVGSILAHNDWARLKSGAGAAIVSACSAVDAFFDARETGHGH